MTIRRFLVVSSLVGMAAASEFTACDPQDPARATIANRLPREGPQSFTVERAWYRTTLFFRPVKPGEASETASVGFGREHAYFVLTLGDPSHRVLAMTAGEIDVSVGEQALVVVDPQTIRSTCVGEKLTEADWRFIRERIFPGDDPAIDAFGAPCPTPAAPDAVDGAAADGAPGG